MKFEARFPKPASQPEAGRYRVGRWPRIFMRAADCGLRIVLLLFVPSFLTASCSRPNRSVVVYCAQDQVYAEPIFRDFEREHGIHVRAVYDSEAVKTVGIANRLIAEQAHPQCDVFWGNEEMRTRQLAVKALFRESQGWAAFGRRTRRLVLNTNHLSAESVPSSLLELTNSVWRGRFALAYPQFGTTATHLHALRQRWGTDLWNAWCLALAANQPFLVDGNSAVVQLVARGDAWLGLTDSDDVAASVKQGLPVVAAPLTAETLSIPNTVAIIRGGPHPEAAQRLFDYLQRPQVLERLISAQALEPVLPGSGSPGLKPDWTALLRDLEVTTGELSRFFMR